MALTSNFIQFDFVVLFCRDTDLAASRSGSRQCQTYLPESMMRELGTYGKHIWFIDSFAQVRGLKPSNLNNNTQGIILPTFWEHGDCRGILEEVLKMWQYANLDATELRRAVFSKRANKL